MNTMKVKNSEKRRRPDVENNDREKKRDKNRKLRPPTKKFDPYDLHQIIRKRAYDLYRERGQSNLQGDDLSDWLQAEEELISSNSTGTI